MGDLADDFSVDFAASSLRPLLGLGPPGEPMAAMSLFSVPYEGLLPRGGGGSVVAGGGGAGGAGAGGGTDSTPSSAFPDPQVPTLSGISPKQLQRRQQRQRQKEQQLQQNQQRFSGSTCDRDPP